MVDYYATVGSSTVLVVCWLIGRLELSILWLMVAIMLNCARFAILQERKRRLSAQHTMAVEEKQSVMANLKELPPWVQFPDVERVDFLNTFIAQAWPGICEFAKKFLKEEIEDQIRENLPKAFRSFRFESIDMGDTPPRIGGIKMYKENVGRDQCVMDVDIAYAGDIALTVAVGCFQAGVEKLQFQGKLRCLLKPLISEPPWFGSFTIFFLNEPAFDFDLTGAGEFLELPGLTKALHFVVNQQISSLCVAPNEITVPVVKEVDMARISMVEPQGVVRVVVHAAKNLEDKDALFKGKSDPYCRLSVGCQIYKTKTIDDNLNPVWNEQFDAIVEQSGGQNLSVELYDEDPGSQDEFLGGMELALDAVRERALVSDWFQLGGVKHGELHLTTYWFGLSTDVAVFHKNDLPQGVDTKERLSHALLMVFVDSVSNLPSIAKNFEPSPFVQLSVGNTVQKTRPRLKTNNPVYQRRFDFLVMNVEYEHLKIEAKDKSSKRSLGELSIPIRNIAKEAEMELKQATWHLALGPHLSPVILTLKLRLVLCMATFTPVVRLPPLPSIRDVIRIYGLKARRQLSQNFIMDMNLTRKLISKCGTLSGKYVCEIGPGPGGLTRAILEQSPAQVSVIEKDRRFQPGLELLADASPCNMCIHMADVMDFDMSTLFPEEVKYPWSGQSPPVVLVGNLPFSVSTHLIIRLLRAMSLRQGLFTYGRSIMSLTFQKEVGERMIAPLLSDQRCRLSAMCQFFSRIRRRMTIPGRAFVPAPKVDVVLMQFEPHVHPVVDQHFDLVEKFCRHLYHFRNKHCIRGVETLYPEHLRCHFADQVFRRTRLNPKSTAPSLSIEEIRDMCVVYEEQCLQVPHLFYYDYRQHKTFEETEEKYPPHPPTNQFV